MAAREKCVSCGLLSVGGLLIVLGAIMLTVFPVIIRDQVRKRAALGLNPNGTLNEMTAKWADPAFHLKMEVWMISVVNSEAVVNGAKPRVIQKGPFTFREKMHKEGIMFIDNQTKIYYRNKKTYTFDRNESCADCDLDYRVTIPSIVFQKAISFAATKGGVIREAFEVLLKMVSETPFVTVTVGEALFDGYSDKLITAICNHTLLRDICEKLARVPKRVGFFYGQNATDDGVYFAHTGQKRIEDLGQIITWKNMTILPSDWWSSSDSLIIKGTDGSLVKPGLDRKDLLHVFVSAICRSTYLSYQSDTEYEGIPAYRYGMSKEILNGSRPENKGFCNPDEPRYYSLESQPVGCLPSGMLDISRCQPGNPPVIISLPHYLYSTEEVQNSIDGLGSPNLAEDEIYVDIEPTAGVTLRAERRMMMNIGMWNADRKISMVENMKNVIIPVLMVNESAFMDDATRDELKGKLINLQKGINTGGIVLLVAGAFLWAVFVVLAIVWTVKKRNESDDYRPLVIHEEVVVTTNDNESDAIRIRPT
uniref:Uncharacterized protein n=1 Tax=Plectus sambesii TaxID=2011161 RepID=A0A914URS9_9BILA